MEKLYEDIILTLANELDMPKQRVYILCQQRYLIEKVESPSLHWEVTVNGRLLLKSNRLPSLVRYLEEASEDLDDGPDLGRQPHHPTKICMNCGKNKTYENFGFSDKTLDNLTKWCSSCW